MTSYCIQKWHHDLAIFIMKHTKRNPPLFLTYITEKICQIRINQFKGISLMESKPSFCSHTQAHPHAHIPYFDPEEIRRCELSFILKMGLSQSPFMMQQYVINRISLNEPQQRCPTERGFNVLDAIPPISEIR